MFQSGFGGCVATESFSGLLTDIEWAGSASG